MNGLLICLGIIVSCGLVGFCWFEAAGVISTERAPEEPKPRVMTLDEAIKELEKEKTDETQ